MKSSNRSGHFIIALVVSLLLSGLSAADVPNDVSVVANGDGTRINVTIEMFIGGTLPPEWVGWVLDRSTVGDCDDPVVAIGGEPNPFPTGTLMATILDYGASPTRTYKYRIYAVDAGGVRHALPGFTMFPPVYYQFDFASVDSDAAVAEGRLFDLGYAIGLEICTEDCWEFIAFIHEPPAVFQVLAENNAVVRVFGQLDAEFEGPYVTQVTDWAVADDCFAIPAETAGWGGVKAMYR